MTTEIKVCLRKNTHANNYKFSERTDGHSRAAH